MASAHTGDAQPPIARGYLEGLETLNQHGILAGPRVAAITVLIIAGLTAIATLPMRWGDTSIASRTNRTRSGARGFGAFLWDQFRISN